MKKLIFSVLAVAAMASCSKSELTERSNDGVAIMAKSEVLTVTSKAPFEGITSTQSLVARVLASTASGQFDPTQLYHDADMTFGDGSTTTPVGYNPSKAYPSDGSSVFLCGLYPADANWTNFSPISGATPRTTADLEFDGKTDVMVAAQVETKKADVLAATPVYQTLKFNHMLTKMVIRAKAASTEAITNFGGVTDITLLKASALAPNNTITATINTGVATPGTAAFSNPSSITSFPFYTIDAAGVGEDTAFAAQNVALVEVDGTTVTEAPKIAYSMIAPIIATGTDDYVLLVKTEKNQTGFNVPVSLKDAGGSAFTGTTQGKAFVITLEFESTPIVTLCEVAGWDEVIMKDDIIIK